MTLRKKIRKFSSPLRWWAEGVYLRLLATAWVGEMSSGERDLLRALVRVTRYLSTEEVVYLFTGNLLVLPYGATSWHRYRLGRFLVLADKLARTPEKLLIWS